MAESILIVLRVPNFPSQVALSWSRTAPYQHGAKTLILQIQERSEESVMHNIAQRRSQNESASTNFNSTSQSSQDITGSQGDLGLWQGTSLALVLVAVFGAAIATLIIIAIYTGPQLLMEEYGTVVAVGWERGQR